MYFFFAGSCAQFPKVLRNGGDAEVCGRYTGEWCKNIQNNVGTRCSDKYTILIQLENQFNRNSVREDVHY